MQIYSLYGMSSMGAIPCMEYGLLAVVGHQGRSVTNEVPAATLSRAGVQDFDHAALDGRDRRQIVPAELLFCAAPGLERKPLLLPIGVFVRKLAYKPHDL